MYCVGAHKTLSSSQTCIVHATDVSPIDMTRLTWQTMRVNKWTEMRSGSSLHGNGWTIVASRLGTDCRIDEILDERSSYLFAFIIILN